jgi:hypothetical protein
MAKQPGKIYLVKYRGFPSVEIKIEDSAFNKAMWQDFGNYQKYILKKYKSKVEKELGIVIDEELMWGPSLALFPKWGRDRQIIRPFKAYKEVPLSLNLSQLALPV